MNLIWDRQAKNNPEYLKFLSAICRVDDKSISIN